ncbi:hypothetical protein OBCHQ24_17095 [Oceanobacillus iheyensis]|nr:hypothetical protein OBCHQ24_17095 [Oceanobacillus iheyensis]
MADRKERRKVKSKWKKLFYSLLAINVVVVVILLALIFWPVPDASYPENEATSQDESSEFVVRTTKQNLNDLINAYTDQLLKGTSHHYRIELDEDVHLIGELPVFSATVPLSAHLEPLVQENGDIILKQKSISIGLLELPNQKIMEYIGKYLPMPDWVTVNPKEEEIYVAVTEMDIRSNFEVGVEHIDLEANNLAFRIRIPYQTLGID